MPTRAEQTGFSRKRLPLIVGLLLVGAAAVGIVFWWGPRGERPAFGYDPRGVYESTPFRNAKPGVQYVGDQVCAECHADIAETYQRHPMGRSLTLVANREPIERLNGGARPFEQLGLEFAVLEDQGRMVHRALHRGPREQVLAQADMDIQYVMGSGTRGRSYLFERDGYLFQSPISWFTQKAGWDLSPGFEAFYPPERVIEPSCLFCHSNRAEPVEHARNQYHLPVFRGHAIGCERCHGPGELHVALKRAGSVAEEAVDYTIVNPRHLSGELREAVCQQCHLQGERRLERAGRKTFDYRPGLPLFEFWAVFVMDPAVSPTRKAVGQVEQMQMSRCFARSGGQLGCISCHDPHAVPSAEDRVAFYRGRCLNCHGPDLARPPAARGNEIQAPDCSLPRDLRLRQQKDDSCVACHMPRFKSSDIAHTAVTDHRVLRSPRKERAKETGPLDWSGDRLPIINFFARQCPPGDPRADRDLGVALGYLSDRLADQPQLRQMCSARAVPLLEKAVGHAPADVTAWDFLGWTLSLQGRREEALQAYERALELAPESERSLSLAAALCTSMKRHEDALRYLRRLVKVNPWIWEHRFDLARLLTRRGEWIEALAESESALKLSPTHKETRMLFISCCLHTARTAQARREFDTLLAMHPREEKKLRTWFAEQVAQAE